MPLTKREFKMLPSVTGHTVTGHTVTGHTVSGHTVSGYAIYCDFRPHRWKVAHGWSLVKCLKSIRYYSLNANNPLNNIFSKVYIVCTTTYSGATVNYICKKAESRRNEVAKWHLPEELYYV